MGFVARLSATTGAPGSPRRRFGSLVKSRMGKKGKKSRRGAAQLRDPWAGTRLQRTPEGERYESIFESLRENAHRDGAARADGLLVAQQYLSLDDDTSKPALPLTAPELYWREVERRAKWLDARPIRSWEALSAADRQPWIETSAAGSELYAAQVAFCAKSGSELLGEHFIDLCTKPPLTRWIVQMKEGAYDVSGGDKDATTYVTAVEGDRAWDPNKGDVVICVKLSLREVRAGRAATNARQKKHRSGATRLSRPVRSQRTACSSLVTGGSSLNPIWTLSTCTPLRTKGMNSFCNTLGGWFFRGSGLGASPVRSEP